MNHINTHDMIDLCADLHAIRQKFGPKYYQEPQATIEAAALWGAKCNSCGVLTDVTERIRVEHQGYRATLRLYESEKGYWHVSRSFDAPNSGSGSPASVWDGIAFTNALAARRYGIGRLLERCDQQERFDKSAALAAFRRKLEAELTPQLTLF